MAKEDQTKSVRQSPKAKSLSTAILPGNPDGSVEMNTRKPMIKTLVIQNFKVFSDFTLNLNPGLNIIVGDNEAGKSTVLEAINLALTKRLSGRPVEYELSSHLFNKACADSFVAAVQARTTVELPQILIELYLADEKEFEQLRGTNNSQRADCPGIKVEMAFDEDYREEYEKLLETPEKVTAVPAEYYTIHWYSFAHNAITTRSLGIVASHIDATSIRLQSGTDYYLQNIISNGLNPKERVALAIAYRNLKEEFSKQPAIKEVNRKLTETPAPITLKQLAVAIDTSPRAGWESNLVPHLDDVPFQFIGKGEQSALKILLAIERQAAEANVVLVEEPENHLSFTSMSALIAKIQERCVGKQIVLTTHSAYVLNKLGLEYVHLLSGNQVLALRTLPADTYKYFKKLPGYDTLRLILAKRAILVEGPSDELIVQKAYYCRHNKLPIQDGIDVISVRGLSFRRFLDIAERLRTHVTIITDNDGDFQSNVVEKYKPYADAPNIKVCADPDDSAPTLEPQFAKCNSLSAMNKIFDADYEDTASLVKYMTTSKTEWALKVFDSTKAITFPKYILDAVQ